MTQMASQKVLNFVGIFNLNHYLFEFHCFIFYVDIVHVSENTSLLPADRPKQQA
jgi:hypothetical protein